jgi:UDP-2,3-diacylglucosamine pyrophosphatase LpxH
MAKINAFEEVAAELAIEKKYDYVICGHIHQPQKRIIEKESGKVIYLNSGDWVEHMSALEYHNHEWSIFEYDKSQFSEDLSKETVQPISVVTDNIHYYINSLAI